MSLTWQVRDGITLMVEDLVDAVEVPGMCVAKAGPEHAALVQYNGEDIVIRQTMPGRMGTTIMADHPLVRMHQMLWQPLRIELEVPSGPRLPSGTEPAVPSRAVPSRRGRRA